MTDQVDFLSFRQRAQWFRGVTDQAGNPLTVFCGRCHKQLDITGCSIPPWTGFVIPPHRCEPP